MEKTKYLNIKLVASPIYRSDENSKDIYLNSESWSGNKNTTEGTIYGFFEKKNNLERKGITNYNFLYYSHLQIKTEEIMNGDDEKNYFIIRWGIDLI